MIKRLLPHPLILSLTHKPTHTHTHTLTHPLTLIHSHSHTLTHTQSPFSASLWPVIKRLLPHPLILSLTHKPTHTHTHTHSLIHSHSSTHTHPLTLTHTHTHTHTHSLTHPLTLTIVYSSGPYIHICFDALPHFLPPPALPLSL